MSLDGTDITKLAAEFAAGAITSTAITTIYGPGVLTAVLGIVGGFAAGSVVGSALDSIDRHTGIVSDVGSLVDDVGSLVGDMFSIFD